MEEEDEDEGEGTEEEEEPCDDEDEMLPPPAEDEAEARLLSPGARTPFMCEWSEDRGCQRSCCFLSSSWQESASDSRLE